MESAVCLWTGGKDSFLALVLARELGYRVSGLATFVPVGNLEFQAHPQSEMKEQATRFGLPLHFIEVREPYRNSYVEGLRWIRSRLGASAVITGDIDLVNGFPNWIVECAAPAKIEVLRPLWKKDRDWVMNQVMQRKIQARISHINHPAIPQEWLGQVIDTALLAELKALRTRHEIDITGENGEYHTMVVAAPEMGAAPAAPKASLVI